MSDPASWGTQRQAGGSTPDSLVDETERLGQITFRVSYEFHLRNGARVVIVRGNGRFVDPGVISDGACWSRRQPYAQSSIYGLRACAVSYHYFGSINRLLDWS